MSEESIREKKGIKVKELARELGCTSRELIDRCRAAGIPVQNSITRLNRGSAEKARALFRDVESLKPEKTPNGRA